MPQWLVVMEAQSKAPTYAVLLDVLERRLGARRILRTAWVIEAPSAQTVYDSVLYYRPFDDGLLILPFSEDRLTRNLRAGQTPARDAAAPAAAAPARAVPAVDQDTPL